ncbi:MAG: hypothetical protein AAFV93_02960 [Chloroflexota bacterium]
MLKHIFLLVLLLGRSVVLAQDEPSPTSPAPVINDTIQAEFRVDNSTPLLGEPFIVTLEIVAASDIRILDWVRFEEPLEVLEEGEISEETLPSGEIEYSREYEVVLWEVGEYLSEELMVTYQQNGAINAVPINSFFVQVPIQIDNPETATLRPLAPPIDVPYISPLVFIGIGVGVIVLLMVIARLIQMSRRRVETIVNASPAERAIAEIEDLKGQNLAPATVYQLVANSLRHYLDGEFGLETIDMTTAELSDELRAQALFPKAHQQRLKQVLEQADLVKFAKFQPDEGSSIRLANFAIKWIQAVERIQHDG